MLRERALQLAATAWCKPETENKAMDVELAKAFADVIMEAIAEEAEYIN